MKNAKCKMQSRDPHFSFFILQFAMERSDRGFIIDTWDKNDNHYDVATGERIAPSHECGAMTKKDGNPCQRRVRGSSGQCFQHK